VIHGDLKPVRAISQSFPPSSTSHQKNVLVDKDGVAKLCDLGLVRLVDWEGSRGLTTTSPYTGTALYKAPELFISLVNRIPVATFEGDIYAIGCILLEVRMQVHKKLSAVLIVYVYRSSLNSSTHSNASEAARRSAMRSWRGFHLL